ncbi:MAG: hypothetical protein N6V49_10790, partial [Serratia symbiotica]|nr:hypothetical protein [Serratia symbiotica]
SVFPAPCRSISGRRRMAARQAVIRWWRIRLSASERYDQQAARGGEGKPVMRHSEPGSSPSPRSVAGMFTKNPTTWIRHRRMTNLFEK